MKFLEWLFLTIAPCDAAGTLDLPSPPHPAEPGEAPIQGPQVPHPLPVIPQLENPQLSDEQRSAFLYSRYGMLNYGGDDGLRRMTSIISNQVIIERSVEAALVDDGFHPPSILHRYRDIRHYLHSPRGELMTERTYAAYVSQIRERGTRHSIPYQRVIQAVRSLNLLLERADGRRF